MRNTKFDIYIKKLQRQVDKDVRLSSDSVDFINAIIQYLIHGIMNIANTLKTNQKTLTAGTIQSAIRLFLTNELVDFARYYGNKAVKNAMKATDTSKRTRATKAKIIFNVTRVESMMVELSLYDRKGKYTAEYLASIVEYICGRILKLSSDLTRDIGRMKTITPYTIAKCINDHYEFKVVFANFTTTTHFKPTQIFALTNVFME